MKKYIISLIAAAVIPFASIFADTSKGASQAWVNYRIATSESNTMTKVNQELQTNVYENVAQALYISQTNTLIKVGELVGNSAYVYNEETDVWTEGGTNLCFKLNGVINRCTITGIDAVDQADGFLVVDDSLSNGAVTNGMFYANNGQGQYLCNANWRIPKIEWAGTHTQVVNSATNYYTAISVMEYQTPSSAVARLEWECTQVNSNDWQALYVDAYGTTSVFRVRYTTGPALSVNFGTATSNSAYSVSHVISIIDIIQQLLVPSAYADKVDGIFVNGLTGGFTIHFLYNEVSYSVSVEMSYSGPMTTYPTSVKQETKDNFVYEVHTEWDPNPYASTYSDYIATGNWIKNPTTVVFTDNDGNKVSKNFTQKTMTFILKDSLPNALSAAYKEPVEYVWEKELGTRCSFGCHWYHDNTCKCYCCGYDRKHNFVQTDITKCWECDKPLGWIGGDSMLEKAEGGKCGGHSSDVTMHTGFHHAPGEAKKPTVNKSPMSAGFNLYCTCECGYFGNGKNSIAKEHDKTDWYYVAGDYLGNDADYYHCHVTECNLCKQCGLGQQGWSASVEPHELDKEKENEIICVDVNGNPCAVDSDKVSKEAHLARGTCAKLGCEHNIDGYVPHVFTSDKCICSDCGAILHEFDKAAMDYCPNIAVCTICGRSYTRTGGVIDKVNAIASADICKYHSYGPESKVEGDYVNHYCFCHYQIPHAHTWQASAEDPDVQVCVQAADGTEGCGMVREHDPNSCTSENCEPSGYCGHWYCRICGKDISGYEGAWTDHATYSEGRGSEGYLSGEDADGKFRCAICDHSFKGVKCGTTYTKTVNSSGEIVYTSKREPHVLDDYRCHFGWKPYGETTAEHMIQHICACEKDPKYYTHHWTQRAVDFGDDINHNLITTCNASGYDDICNWSYTELDNHDWETVKTDGIPHYSYYNDSKCRVQTVCRHRYNGDDVGCGKTSFNYASHNWHPLSSFGMEDEWKVGGQEGTEKYAYSQCVKKRKCEISDHPGSAYNRYGCGIEAYNYTESHIEINTNFTFNGTVVTPTNPKSNCHHLYDIRCAHDCGWSGGEDKQESCSIVCNTNTRAQVVGTETPDGYHGWKSTCSKCLHDLGFVTGGSFDTIEKHDGHGLITLGPYYGDSTQHYTSNICLKCSNRWYNWYENHDGVDREESRWDAKHFLCCVTGSTDTATCRWGMHTLSNYCSSCEHWYDKEVLCSTDSTDWEMGDDGIDQATCRICGGGWAEACHLAMTNRHEEARTDPETGMIIWVTVGDIVEPYEGGRYLDEEYHACWHGPFAAGEAYQSPVHLKARHKVVNGWCEYCNHEVGTGYYGRYKPTDNELTLDSYLAWLESMGLSKESMLWTPGLDTIDGNDPVYKICEGALENAFTNCPVLKMVRFDYVTNMEDRAIANAFSGCTNLGYVGFTNLRDVRMSSISNAFAGCTSISNMNFYSVRSLDAYALENLTPLTNAPNMVLHLEHLESMSGVFNRSLTEIGIKEVRLDYSHCSNLVGSAFTRGTYTGWPKIYVPTAMKAKFVDAGFNEDNLVTTNTISLGEWKVYRDGVETNGYQCVWTNIYVNTGWFIMPFLPGDEITPTAGHEEATIDDYYYMMPDIDNPDYYKTYATQIIARWGWADDVTNAVHVYRAVRQFETGE